MHDAVVIGAGLSGAACAWALADASLRVLVLEQASAVATGGASALPVGLMAPLPPQKKTTQAALVAAGVERTLWHCQRFLQQGVDWQPCGAEQRYVKKQRSDVATFSVWHEQAAWIKPAALVGAWLASSKNITVQCNTQAQAVKRCDDGWELDIVCNGRRNRGVCAPRVVLALGADSPAWLKRNGLATSTPLHTVAGHVVMGDWASLQPHYPNSTFASSRNSANPVAFNGKGHCIPNVPANTPNQLRSNKRYWLAGSTYEHTALDKQAALHNNMQRLTELLPECRAAIDVLAAEDIRLWHGVRCTSATRLPVIERIVPTLHMLTAMGSRGLSLAAYSAEKLRDAIVT